MLSGGCCCGRIRYEVTGAPFQETICHCSICRRMAGAPMVAWFSAPLEEFHFVQGEPARFRSPQAIRSFCPNCGTQLTFAHDDFPREIDITTASLDDPNQVPPRDHTYAATRLDWVRLGDSLPQFRASRQEG